jgi:hypothetical protein
VTARPELDALLVNLDWLIAAPSCAINPWDITPTTTLAATPAVLDAGSAAAMDARPQVPDDSYRPMPSPYGCAVDLDCGGCACHVVRMAPCYHCTDHWTEQDG